MMPFSKRRRSSNYLQHILTDGAKPFLYRTNLRLLLGMLDSTGINRIFPVAAPPVEFVYSARRIQDRFKMNSFDLAGKTTASAFNLHKRRQNGREEMIFPSFTQKDDFVESTPESYLNNNQGKVFPDRIGSHKEPTKTQQISSIAQNEGVPETPLFKDNNDRAPISGSAQKEKGPSPSPRIIAIPGMTTSPFIPSLLREFEDHEAMPDKNEGETGLSDSTGDCPTKKIGRYTYDASSSKQDQKRSFDTEVKKEKYSTEMSASFKRSAKKISEHQPISAAISNMESRRDTSIPLINLRQNAIPPTLPFAYIETTPSPSASKLITPSETKENRKAISSTASKDREEASLFSNSQRNDKVEFRQEEVGKTLLKNFTFEEKKQERPAMTVRKTPARGAMLTPEGNTYYKNIPVHGATAYSTETRKIKSEMLERNSSSISMTTVKPVYRQEEGFTIAERMEQIRQTARELTLKNVLQKSTGSPETKENDPQPRPHAAFPFRKIFIVQRQRRKMPVTSIFWQRNCLGRFHLRPLR